MNKKKLQFLQNWLKSNDIKFEFKKETNVLYVFSINGCLKIGESQLVYKKSKLSYFMAKILRFSKPHIWFDKPKKVLLKSNKRNNCILIPNSKRYFFIDHLVPYVDYWLPVFGNWSLKKVKLLIWFNICNGFKICANEKCEEVCENEQKKVN